MAGIRAGLPADFIPRGAALAEAAWRARAHRERSRSGRRWSGNVRERSRTSEHESGRDGWLHTDQERLAASHSSPRPEPAPSCYRSLKLTGSVIISLAVAVAGLG